MSIYSEIKKYLLVLVGFFCLILAGHIVLLYIYHDAENYPLPGGTINIGALGKNPTLNVLAFDTKIENDPNDTVLRFMYRWLVRFSPVDKKMVGDLASCTIENFPLVRCKLGANALWNDGTNVVSEDVVATYAYFREKSTNPSTKSQLELLEVSEDAGEIVFRFKTRDVTALQSLFLPIVRKKDLTADWTGLVHEQLSFNGPYIYTSKEAKKDTILLTRNLYYTHTIRPQYFDQVRFGFGETNADIYDVINPDILLSDTSVDLEEQVYPYTRPVFWATFMNAERLPVTLRKAIFYDVFGAMDRADPALKPEENIFFGEILSTPRTASESIFFQTVFSLGYSFGGTFQAPVNAPAAAAPTKPLTYITAPGTVSPSFIGNPTFDIRGTAPAGTTQVIVNDYTLRNFSSRKRSFSYTAKKEFGNLVLGLNTYRVSFYAGTKLLADESITIYHHIDPNELAKLKTEWEKANAPAVAAPVVAPQNLDPKKLYNRDGKPLAFRIIVQSDTPYLARIGEQAAQKLREFGADVEVQTLPLSEIQKNLTDANFAYDMVLTGVHLGLFHYNVSPFFHSSQIKSGYNMVRIKDTTLDSLLARLTDRLYYSAPDKLRDIEINIQKILERESAVFTFGSPYEYIALKKTVLWFKTPEFLTGREMLVDVLSRWYFKEWFKRSVEPKTVLWFFEWLKNALFPST